MSSGVFRRPWRPSPRTAAQRWVPSRAPTNRTLTVDSLAITLSASAVTLTRTLPFDTLAVTITASDVTLRRGRFLVVGSASVAVTASPITLRVSRRIAVGSASVAITGTAITPKVAHRLAVGSAAVTVSATDVLLTKSGNYAISVGSAAVTLTLSPIGLTVARRLSVTSAAVTLTASAVGCTVARRLSVGSATLTLAAAGVTLTKTAPAGTGILDAHFTAFVRLDARFTVNGAALMADTPVRRNASNVFRLRHLRDRLAPGVFLDGVPVTLRIVDADAAGDVVMAPIDFVAQEDGTGHYLVTTSPAQFNPVVGAYYTAIANGDYTAADGVVTYNEELQCVGVAA